MKREMKKYCICFCIFAAICIVWTPTARGQTATAEIVGRIMDASGAVVPQADVAVVNLETNVKRTVQSGASGNYTIPLLGPGLYRLTVSKAGFKPAEVPNITLAVNQTLTLDVALSVGSVTQTIEVKAEAALIQASTSELGTVVEQKEVHDLPLNGRNFTQLLTLVPGVTPVSTAQFTTIGIDGAHSFGLPTSTVAAPSLSGQWNRGTLYMEDGVLNMDMTTDVYTVPIVVDAIQEFKVQMHNDKAEYGGVLGGVVNVVTRGGSNHIHGSAYEFVRNNWFDARDSFLDEFRSSPSPFRQNQFGGTVGGPILIPKLYNGRNRTFFFFAYEGWRYSQAAESRYVVPTAAELSGDFSHSLLNQPIYDPTTTAPDPSNPGEYLRTQFAGNMIPSGRIDAKVVSFLQSYAGAPNLTGDPVHNAIVAIPITSNSGQYDGRIDEQIGVKDNAFFGWSQIGITQLNPTTLLQHGGMSAIGRTVRAGWNHTFTPNLILEARGGRTERPTTEYIASSKVPLSTMVGLGFTSPGGSQISLASPWTSYGIEAPSTSNYPSDHISGNLIWVHGNHNFKSGVQYIYHGSDQTFSQYATFSFSNGLTENPELPGTTGSSLASSLLGLPSQTNIFAIPVLLIDNVSTWAEYGQDEWKVRSNLTLTYGLRFDHRRPYAPSAGNFDAGFVPNGDYWIGLNQMPGLCSTVGKAPCLPTPVSQIPDGNHIMLSPYGTAYGPKPEWDEWGPRVGLAWHVNQKTVVRGGYGIVYDPLTGMDQDWKGFLGSWPAAGGGWSIQSWNQTLGQPLTTLEQTFGRVGAALPIANPWNQTNWFFDPNRKDARSQQWNLEVQRQMGNNLALSIGYVGSYSDRLDQTVLWNTATTSGPGTADQVNALRIAPWEGTNFMGYSTGTANYNGLEVRLERRFAQGLYYLLSYTYSKSIDLGSSGWFDAENGSGGGVQNAYDLKGSRSVSAYDIPHYLSMTGIYDLPFGTGKKYFNQHGMASRLLGNWQLNSIVQLRSGVPYSMSVTGDVANIGNTVSWYNYARPNLVGNANVSNPTSEEWFNPSAFAVPSFSYGNVGRNTLRSAPCYNADFSLFKNFPIREGLNLSFRAEFFNIFNIQNYAAPDSLVGDPAEGRVTSNVTAPRQIQLALRLTF
jgi:hypothetical protein